MSHHDHNVESVVIRCHEKRTGWDTNQLPNGPRSNKHCVLSILPTTCRKVFRIGLKALQLNACPWCHYEGRGVSQGTDSFQLKPPLPKRY